MSTEDVFLERMAVFAFVEKRPFCFRDFLLFEHEGKEYHFGHGTIRNIFAKLRKDGKIEFVYQTTHAYHTLAGSNVGKSITPNHGEDHLFHKQSRFLSFLDNLPMDKPSIHDIRLRFAAKGLWSMLSSTPASPAASRLVKSIDLQKNRDITLHDIDLKDHTIKTTVHRTDTVTVMVACSYNPIPIDIMGLAKLTSGLTRVEERLRMLHGFGVVDGGGGGQFNAPYCNCGPVMAAALYPLVRGSGSPQSSLPTSLMDTRCSSQRGGNTSLPYKHFHNMSKVILLTKQYYVQPYLVGKDKRSLAMILPAELVKSLNIDPSAILILLKVMGNDELKLIIVRQEAHRGETGCLSHR